MKTEIHVALILIECDQFGAFVNSVFHIITLLFLFRLSNFVSNFHSQLTRFIYKMLQRFLKNELAFLVPGTFMFSPPPLPPAGLLFPAPFALWWSRFFLSSFALMAFANSKKAVSTLTLSRALVSKNLTP